MTRRQSRTTRTTGVVAERSSLGWTQPHGRDGDSDCDGSRPRRGFGASVAGPAVEGTAGTGTLPGARVATTRLRGFPGFPKLKVAAWSLVCRSGAFWRPWRWYHWPGLSAAGSLAHLDGSVTGVIGGRGFDDAVAPAPPLRPVSRGLRCGRVRRLPARVPRRWRRSWRWRRYSSFRFGCDPGCSFDLVETIL